jgi:hypothetical protein
MFEKESPPVKKSRGEPDPAAAEFSSIDHERAGPSTQVPPRPSTENLSEGYRLVQFEYLLKLTVKVSFLTAGHGPSLLLFSLAYSA